MSSSRLAGRLSYPAKSDASTSSSTTGSVLSRLGTTSRNDDGANSGTASASAYSPSYSPSDLAPLPEFHLCPTCGGLTEDEIVISPRLAHRLDFSTRNNR